MGRRAIAPVYALSAGRLKEQSKWRARKKPQIRIIRLSPAPLLGGANVECKEYVTGMKLCLCSGTNRPLAIFNSRE